MYFPRPGYNTIVSIDENTVNNSWDLNHESSRPVSKNGGNTFPPIPSKEGLSGYEKQQVRNTILQQEAVFQHQLHELHRIYRRQMDITNQIQYQMHYQRLKQYKDPPPMDRANINPYLPRGISSSIPTYNGVRSGDCTSHNSRRQKLPRRSFDLEVPANKYVDDEVELWNNGLIDLNEPVQVDSSSSDSVEMLENSINCSIRELQGRGSFASSNLRIQYLPKEVPQKSRNGIDAGFCLNRGKELPSSYNSSHGRTSGNGMPVNGGLHSANSSTLFKSLQYDPGKAYQPFELPQFDQKKIEPPKRNTLFGVDISKDGTDSFGTPLLRPSSLSIGLSSLSSSSNLFCSEKLASISSPNLLSDMKDGNGSRSFNEKFPKQITDEKWISNNFVSANGKNKSGKLYESLPWLNKPIYGAAICKEISKPTIMNNCRSNGMILGKSILEVPTMTKPSFVLAINGDCSTKNVPFNTGEQFKDDATVARSERNSHIDLNMCLDELDSESSLVSESSQEETRIAAEAILAISSDPQQAQAQQTDDSSLHWFADVISSFKGDIEAEKGTFLTGDINEGAPKFDYFEFMTLRLTETISDEQLYYKPTKITEVNKEDEKRPKRTRRGQGKRRKQLKDFQKDVLPSIGSLSRYEVTEDLQMIEGIIRTSGRTWEPSLTRRNGNKGSTRGRMRAVGGGGGNSGSGSALVSTVTTALPIPAPEEMISPNKSALEEQSLGGWGKKTRRPPRQKCPVGNSNSPLLVK